MELEFCLGVKLESESWMRSAAYHGYNVVAVIRPRPVVRSDRHRQHNMLNLYGNKSLNPRESTQQFIFLVTLIIPVNTGY